MENRIKLLRLGSRCLLSLFQWPVFFQIYIWYYLKNVKNTHGGVLLLVKLQAKACNVTKSFASQ